jgi:hypothetical protein
MPGPSDVVNAALVEIGGSRITSLTDGSTNANAANDIYTEIRDGLLRSHNWNFATKRAKLAQSSTVPAFEFDYAYPLPSDWIRTTSVHNNDAGHGTVFYRMEIVGTQRAILADSDQLYIRYVYQVTDPNQMAADFRRAFELALARSLSLKIPTSNTVKAELVKEANRALNVARSTDSMGQSPEIRPRGSWSTVRSGRRDGHLID